MLGIQPGLRRLSLDSGHVNLMLSKSKLRDNFELPGPIRDSPYGSHVPSSTTPKSTTSNTIGLPGESAVPTQQLAGMFRRQELGQVKHEYMEKARQEYVVAERAHLEQRRLEYIRKERQEVIEKREREYIEKERQEVAAAQERAHLEQRRLEYIKKERSDFAAAQERARSEQREREYIEGEARRDCRIAEDKRAYKGQYPTILDATAAIERKQDRKGIKLMKDRIWAMARRSSIKKRPFKQSTGAESPTDRPVGNQEAKGARVQRQTMQEDNDARIARRVQVDWRSPRLMRKELGGETKMGNSLESQRGYLMQKYTLGEKQRLVDHTQSVFKESSYAGIYPGRGRVLGETEDLDDETKSAKTPDPTLMVATPLTDSLETDRPISFAGTVEHSSGSPSVEDRCNTGKERTGEQRPCDEKAMETSASKHSIFRAEHKTKDEDAVQSRILGNENTSNLKVSDYEESIMQSEDSEGSDGSTSLSPEEDANVTIAFAKHELIASPMQDVYAMFNAHWDEGTRNHTASQSQGCKSRSERPHDADQAPPEQGDKQENERDSPPPNDGDDKRRRANPRASDPARKDRKLLLACPFHKNDPSIYRANHTLGSDFRACAGPGLPTISRLK